MTLNLQRRFLLLFADYRDAVDGQQRAQDELLILRNDKAELQARLDKAIEGSLNREREWNERLMRRQFGDRIVEGVIDQPRQATKQSEPEESPLQWQKRKWNEFQEAIRNKQIQLNGPAVTQ
jgi:hypothetical protein